MSESIEKSEELLASLKSTKNDFHSTMNENYDMYDDEQTSQVKTESNLNIEQKKEQIEQIRNEINRLKQNE